MDDKNKILLMGEKKENFSDQDKSVGKKPFLKPKLKYIKPKLIKYGKINHLTTGTPSPFGTFSPPDPDDFDQDPRF